MFPGMFDGMVVRLTLMLVGVGMARRESRCATGGGTGRGFNTNTRRLTMKYPIAPHGIFHTFQGEAFLLGEPMRFVRLAGCSVGCEQCDTDYSVDRRMTVDEIAAELDALPKTHWLFLTGGEPFDHDCGPIVAMMRQRGQVAAVTSGHRRCTDESLRIDCLMVSPHGKPSDLQFKRAAQINLVPGLKGLKLSDWEDFDFAGFTYRYCTPLHGGLNQRECEDWVQRHSGKWGFRLGVQAHKSWGVA